jgi:hypothetical protein
VWLSPSRCARSALAAVVLTAGCSQVVNIERNTDAHNLAQLNPFGSVVEYDVDPALVIDVPHRVCIGPVTISAHQPKPDDRPPSPTSAQQWTELPGMLQRSFEAHARVRLEDLDIAVIASKAGEDPIQAALDGCTYLLTADLVEDNEIYTLFWSRRQVGVELRLAAVESDQTVWSARHVDARNEGSLPLDPLSLVVSVVRTQDFASDSDILPSMIDDVMRHLFATFPELPADAK